MIEYAKELISSEIKTAFDLPAEEAIRGLEEIAREIDDLSGLCNTRFRRLLLKCELPPLIINRPDWVIDGFQKLYELGPGFATNAAIDSASKIVQAFLYEQPNAKAEIDYAGLGRVGVEWLTGGDPLSWMVSSVNYPWPGVHIRAYVGYKSFTFFYAKSAINHALNYFK